MTDTKHRCIECNTTKLSRHDKICTPCYWEGTAGRDPKVEYISMHADEMPNGYGSAV